MISRHSTKGVSVQLMRIKLRIKITKYVKIEIRLPVESSTEKKKSEERMQFEKDHSQYLELKVRVYKICFILKRIRLSVRSFL